MLLTFLNHQWKAFLRSRNKGGTIAAQIFLGLIMLYFIAVALLLGFSMSHWIALFFPGKDVTGIFNGFILYYFAIDFLIRLQMQDLPTISIVPYLHLRIPRKRIVTFLNIRALFNVFNLLPLLIFIPFCTTTLVSLSGPFAALMYVVSLLSLIVFNNYTALFIKRLSAANMKVIALAGSVIVALGLLEYFNVFSIAACSSSVFRFITQYPPAGLGFVLAAALVYRLNSGYLYKNLYTEELSTTQEQKGGTDYPFLKRFGAAGTLAALELKLILRNKRPRSTVMMSLIFLVYGFFFYKPEIVVKDEFNLLLFAAIFMTGSGICIYGQFMFGWQGAHFDGILANKTNLRDFVKAKFLLFTVLSTISTLVVSLYGLISWKILLVQLAAYFYNIGIGTVIVLYFATRNYKTVDLTKGSAFNYQGVGASQLVMGIPYFLAPYVFYLPFAAPGYPYLGLAFLGICGLTALLTRAFWIDFILRALTKRKYKIAEGFREH